MTTALAPSLQGAPTKRILVVDDHPVVGLALRVAFRRDGRFQLLDVAATGADGLGRLEDADAVLLDLRLPDMDGADVAREMRRRRPRLPLIAHSSSDAPRDLERVRALVDAVVLKSRIGDTLDALARLTGA